MPDYPSTLVAPQPTTLSTVGATTYLGEYCVMTNTGQANAIWPVANKALFVPVWVEQPCTAYQMGCVVAVQSGNMDVGIYSVGGARLVSIGTTAVGAVGFQAFNITDTVLMPGIYFLAMAVNNITASFRRIATTHLMISQALGVQEMTTAFVLPATATFANPAANYVPLLTVSLVETI